MIAKKITERIDEIDSFESKFKGVVLKNNNLIIPYFNLGVSQHPLNEMNDLKYLNFSYIVCLNVSYLAGWSEEERIDVVIIDGIKKEQVYYFGGENLDDKNSIFNDFKICCKEIYLQTLDTTELSDKKWKMDDEFIKEKVSDFWNGKFMPTAVKELIG